MLFLLYLIFYDQKIEMLIYLNNEISDLLGKYYSNLYHF
jgi:hypothetical protein